MAERKKPTARVTLRVDLGSGADARIGPGKIALLEAIRDHSSISAAGRQFGMSYRTAWLLVDAMNRLFKTPVVTTATGGKAGGGASLTPLGENLIAAYRELEHVTLTAGAKALQDMEKMVANGRLADWPIGRWPERRKKEE
jgi:molybdate transport system regulatory protein